ncbi:MAG: hypothetical protein J0M24_09290 [Verrucomicrobia bacterium]|nr:hypothetical protein [Verrucomicrobiota bacterium]
MDARSQMSVMPLMSREILLGNLPLVEGCLSDQQLSQGTKPFRIAVNADCSLIFVLAVEHHQPSTLAGKLDHSLLHTIQGRDEREAELLPPVPQRRALTARPNPQRRVPVRVERSGGLHSAISGL